MINRSSKHSFGKMISLVGLVSLAISTICMPVAAEEKMPAKITYDDHVKPILQQKCFSCHRPDKKSSDLDLTTYTNLMAGGASGAVVEPGDASGSYLYELVTHESEPVMPPEQPKIADEMIETIRKWIDGGLLENSGSTAQVTQKKKFDMALTTAPTDRPEVAPMPGRLSLQPFARTPATTSVDALATSPWSPLVAVGGPKQVLLYNTQSLDLVGVLPFPEGTPRVLKFSRNGSLLLAGGGVAGASGRVVVWNIRSGQRIIEVGEEIDEVLAADISSDQTLVAMGGPERVVRVYSTETGRLMHEIRKHTDWITSLEFSPDSVLLATGDRNGGLFVWEAWTGREYLTLNGHTNSITEVSWRPDSSILASSSEDTTVRLWEMENGAEVKNWGAHGTGALSVEFTRDGRLVTSGRDNLTRLWDQNGGKQRDFEAFADLAVRVTYCDETSRAIAGDWTGEIRVWNSADGARLGTLTANAPTLEERLSAASQLVGTKQTEQKPLADAFQVAQAEMEKVTSDFAAAQKEAAEAKQKNEASVAALAAANQQLAIVTSERDAVNKSLGEANAMAPVLKEGADKAMAAAAQLPADQELAEAAAKIKAVADSKAAELLALQKSSQEKTVALEKAQVEMTNAQNGANQAAAILAAASKKEQELMPLIKPAEEKQAAAKASYDQATAALTSAQQSVARWTDEIAFSKQLADLNSQRAAAIDALAEQETAHGEALALVNASESELNAANAELVKAQAELANHQQQHKAALAVGEVAKQSLASATKLRSDVAASNAVLVQLIAALTEASGKADQAASISKDDQPVAEVANNLKSLLVTRSEQLQAGEADLVNKVKAEQDAQVDLANKEKATVDALAILDATTKQVASLEAAKLPLVQKVDETKKAAEITAQAVVEAEQAVEVVQKSIAIAQGLEPAA